MRKLNGGDVFAALRLMRALDLTEPIKAIGKQLEQAKTNDDKSAAGLQFLGTLLENATDPKAEELIWNFLAGPFEKKNGAAAKAMEINELADAVGELMKENDLAVFFGKVRRLIPMK